MWLHFQQNVIAEVGYVAEAYLHLKLVLLLSASVWSVAKVTTFPHTAVALIEGSSPPDGKLMVSAHGHSPISSPNTQNTRIRALKREAPSASTQ